MGKKTGRRWFDTKTDRCRANTKRKVLDADGKVIRVLSRGRFVDCDKQLRAKFQCRDPHGGWAPGKDCAPGGRFHRPGMVNWRTAKPRDVLEHSLQAVLLGRVRSKKKAPPELKAAIQVAEQQALPFTRVTPPAASPTPTPQEPTKPAPRLPWLIPGALRGALGTPRRGVANRGRRDAMPTLRSWVRSHRTRRWLSAEGPSFLIKEKNGGWELKVQGHKDFGIRAPRKGPYITPWDAWSAAQDWYSSLQGTALYRARQRSK